MTTTWAAELAAAVGRPPLPDGRRLVLLGEALWVLVYIVAACVGARDGVLAIPSAAIILNVTWEALFTLWRPPKDAARRTLYGLWLLTDLVLLAQAWLFFSASRGAIVATIGLSVSLGAATLSHLWLFRRFRQPYVEAFGLNALMSGLFIVSFYMNDDGRGLSVSVAWLKFLGTGCISAANVIRFVNWGTFRPLLAGFMAIITVLDIAYLWMLYQS